MFVLRFDLRIPPGAALTHAEQYRHALDMARWADERGLGAVTLSEHLMLGLGSAGGPLPPAVYCPLGRSAPEGLLLGWRFGRSGVGMVWSGLRGWFVSSSRGTF